MIFARVDWAEAHHDVCVMGEDGTVLGQRRVSYSVAGIGELPGLIAAGAGLLRSDHGADWRHRFARGGMPALSGKPRSGRPEVHGRRCAAGDRGQAMQRLCALRGVTAAGTGEREDERLAKRPRMSWTLSGEHRTS